MRVDQHSERRLFDLLPYLLCTVGQEDRGAHVETFANVSDADLDDLSGCQRRTQLACHGVHCASATVGHR